jgi:DNA-binding transcriptional LysR family regulator
MPQVGHRMQLAQVEGFLEVARQSNLSRAAEALFITQPALTARLRALEAEVGSPLFGRGRRGMTLTDAGRTFLPYAERAVRALRDGTSAIERLPLAEELVLGAAPAISTYVLPDLLVRFEAANPQVRLSVRTGHSEQILEMAVRGDIEVGLVRELHHPALETLHLYDDELVLVVEPRHPIARQRRVSLERVRDARLIPVRPDVVVLRPDERAVPPGRPAAAGRARARPHRRSEADGPAGLGRCAASRRPRLRTSCATGACAGSSSSAPPRIERPDRRAAPPRRRGPTPAAVDFWATLRVFDAEASREDDSMAGRAGRIARHVDTSTVMERR